MLQYSKKLLTGLVFLMLGFTSFQVAQAKTDYPNKKVRVMVAYGAGGGTDILARMLSKELSEKLGQSFWVENKPGASGMIGTNTIVKSKPDGYNLLLGITALAQTPWLYKDIPYDAQKDLEPIAQVAQTGIYFIVDSRLGVDSIDEFIEYAKNNANDVSLGSYGIGTTSHLFAEQLKSQTDIDSVHVPYKGAGPLMTALLAHEVSAGFVDTPSAKGAEDSGKVKILAVTGTERVKANPDIPTFKELGHDGFDELPWYGFFAPKNTSEEIIDYLNTTINEIINEPSVKEKIEDYGLSLPTEGTKEHFKKVFERSVEYYGEIVEKANIQLEQ